MISRSAYLIAALVTVLAGSSREVDAVERPPGFTTDVLPLLGAVLASFVWLALRRGLAAPAA